MKGAIYFLRGHCNALQHSATHNKCCNTLQHTATHYVALQKQHTVTHCSTLQHPATPCNILQDPATPLNTLQHAPNAAIVWTSGAIRFLREAVIIWSSTPRAWFANVTAWSARANSWQSVLRMFIIRWSKECWSCDFALPAPDSQCHCLICMYRFSKVSVAKFPFGRENVDHVIVHSPRPIR